MGVCIRAFIAHPWQSFPSEPREYMNEASRMNGRHPAQFVESVNEWALIPSFNIATIHSMVLVSASFQAPGIPLEGTMAPPEPSWGVLYLS